MFIVAPSLAVVCIIGYLLLGSIQLNVRVLVVIFWLATFVAIASLFFTSTKKSLKYSSIISVLILLYVPSDSIFAWTAWWINGFAP